MPYERNEPQVLKPRANKAIFREGFQNRESFVTTLLVLLIDVYGTEALTWTPETIRHELRDDFQLTIPDGNLHKIMCGVMLLTTDTFYSSPTAFIQLCNIMADDGFDPNSFSPADCFEIAWGLTEAMLLSPPENDEPFSQEIRYYIGHMLDEEGITDPPDILKIGLRENTNDPLADYSDDPEMYSAFFQNKTSKAAELKDMLKEQLGELLTQLERLPLEHGDTRQLSEKLRKGLNSA